MSMTKREKLKLENIKRANELLDKGHSELHPPMEPVELQPSSNVKNTSKTFVTKMNGLLGSKL
jgi:hypothetical protein